MDETGMVTVVMLDEPRACEWCRVAPATTWTATDAQARYPAMLRREALFLCDECAARHGRGQWEPQTVYGPARQPGGAS